MSILLSPTYLSTLNTSNTRLSRIGVAVDEECPSIWSACSHRMYDSIRIYEVTHGDSAGDSVFMFFNSV